VQWIPAYRKGENFYKLHNPSSSSAIQPRRPCSKKRRMPHRSGNYPSMHFEQGFQTTSPRTICQLPRDSSRSCAKASRSQAPPRGRSSRPVLCLIVLDAPAADLCSPKSLDYRQLRRRDLQVSCKTARTFSTSVPYSLLSQMKQVNMQRRFCPAEKPRSASASRYASCVELAGLVVGQAVRMAHRTVMAP
jgi:hypothetical protein